MTGELYKVTNISDGTVYIGKTYIGHYNRWKAHVAEAYRNDRVHNKFHQAIRMHGPREFCLEKIGEFEQGELEKKEIEYIAKYDSFNNGYNSTVGGEGNKKVVLDEQLICKLFSAGYSINYLGAEYNSTAREISNILKKNGYTVNKCKNIIMEQYDISWRLLRTFESKLKMWQWLIDNYKSDIKAATAYHYTKKASETGGIAFGYHWKQLSEDYRETYNIIQNIDIEKAKKADEKRHSPGRPEIHGMYKKILYTEIQDI